MNKQHVTVTHARPRLSVHNEASSLSSRGLRGLQDDQDSRLLFPPSLYTELKHDEKASEERPLVSTSAARKKVVFSPGKKKTPEPKSLQIPPGIRAQQNKEAPHVKDSQFSGFRPVSQVERIFREFYLLFLLACGENGLNTLKGQCYLKSTFFQLYIML